MIFKTLRLILFITIITSFAFAQKQNVYFLTNDGREVSLKDSADYIRVISEPDSGTTLFNYREYYKNGKVKTVGKTLVSSTKTLEGQCAVFFENGRRKEIAHYKNGQISGEVYDYYPNGKIYKIKKPDYSVLDHPNEHGQAFFINSLLDSTGIVLITDGNGNYINYQENFKIIAEEGSLKNGIKDGTWKGAGSETDSLKSFEEKYDNGKLIEGKSTGLNGKTYAYLQRQVNPEFDGGDKAFYKYLSTTIRYPKVAKEYNITGQVFIQFYVEPNGNLTHFVIVRSPDSSLSNEVLRIMQACPSWKPGLEFGKPVRVKYTVPVNFSMLSN